MEKNDLADFAEQTHRISAELMALVPEEKLDWRPSETGNWWKTGQLLYHLSYSTGGVMKGILKGQWPHEDGTEPSGGEGLYSVSSVPEALEKLEANRVLTAELLAELPDEEYRSRMVPLRHPWEPDKEHPYPLWKMLHRFVLHQTRHQTMLFAYLKLLGIEAGTRTLFGD